MDQRSTRKSSLPLLVRPCYVYGKCNLSIMAQHCAIICSFYFMMTSSNGSIVRITGLCAGNSPVTGEFLAQRPVTRSFDVFFDLRLNKRLSKQTWGWWFEMPSHSLGRHCNVIFNPQNKQNECDNSGVRVCSRKRVVIISISKFKVVYKSYLCHRYFAYMIMFNLAVR